ncbi:hypothetical protein GCM10020000_30210 [Streptomyces olivoverticillatus]
MNPEMKPSAGGPAGWAGRSHLEEKPGAESADGAMELISQLHAALSACSRLLEDLNARRIDPDSFRVQAFRADLVLRDDEAWMWDFASGWHRYDGFGLHHVALPAESPTVAGGDQTMPPGGPATAVDSRGTWQSRDAWGDERS